MRMRSNLEKTILLKNMICGEEMEGNLTRSYFKDLDEAGDTDYGIVIFRDIV